MTTQSPDELALINAAASMLPGAELVCDNGTYTVRTPRGGNNWPPVTPELCEVFAATRDQAEE